MPIDVEMNCLAAQPSRLEKVLPRWLRDVPLYQPFFERLDGETEAVFPLGEFHRLPLITKRDIRRGFPGNFLPAGVNLETLLELDLVEVESTSGTSEERTSLLLGRGWWAAQEERALRLNRLVAGILDEFPEARRVTLSSPVCSGDICYRGVPALTDRIVGQALFPNISRHPFLWSKADLDRMAAETVEWQPQFLDLDPVYGMIFARHCERAGLRLPSLQFILCSYEYLSLVHRRILRRAFGVPVFNLYGSTETGHLLMENEHGQMCPSLDTAFLEVIEPDSDGIGELVVTTLTNDYMPLIRYRIGDLVEPTPCGQFYQAHGRAVDAFATPSGQRVTTRQVDECFAELDGIAHYQLRQEREGSWLLRLVPEDAPPRPAEIAELRQRLVRLLDVEAALEISPTETLLAESSGKFRLGYPAANR